MKRELRSMKLAVSLMQGEEQVGTQSLSSCNPSATNENFLSAGKAILALTGMESGKFKKTSQYNLINEG